MNSKISLGKKIMLIVLSVILAVGAGFSLYFFVFKKNDSKATPVEVINAVSNKLEEVAEILTAGANSEIQAGSNTISNSIGLTKGFEKATIGDFIDEQSFFTGFVHGIAYVANNATPENNYANGFELNKVYSGVAVYEDTEGMMYFFINEVDGGLECNIDFIAEVNTGSTTFTQAVRVNAFFGYDYENDKVEVVRMNYAQSPYDTTFWAVEMDMKSNSFKMMKAACWNTELMSVEDFAEFIGKYNDGTLTFADAATYNWQDVFMCTGNISSNINNMDFDGYTSSSTGTTSNIVINGMFTGIYNVTKVLPIRTTNMDISNAVLVNFMKDAVVYGENRAYVSTPERDGVEYYYMPYLNYNEMLTALNNAKNTMNADSKCTAGLKAIVDGAIGYITNRGEARYTGGLGYYNGATYELEMHSDYDYNNISAGFYSKFYLNIVGQEGRQIKIFVDKSDCSIDRIHTAEVTFKTMCDYIKGKAYKDEAEEAFLNYFDYEYYEDMVLNKEVISSHDSWEIERDGSCVEIYYEGNCVCGFLISDDGELIIYG